MASRSVHRVWVIVLLFLTLHTAGQNDPDDSENGNDGESGKGENKPKNDLPAEDDKERNARTEKQPGVVDVMIGILRAVAYFIAWVPWFVLFLCAFEGSIIPREFYDNIFGDAGKPAPGLTGWLQFIVIPGAIAFYISLIIWLEAQPEKVNWHSFPSFCVQPRGFYGLLNIHQAPWLHINRIQFAYSSFATWFVGPTLLSLGKKPFIFSTFTSAFCGYFLYWCIGSKDACIAGLAPVYYGWSATLLAAMPFECPPKWCRLFLTLMVMGFITARFIEVFNHKEKNRGEVWWGHFCGFIAGLIFGLLHFGSERFCNQRKIAFGTFKGFEAKARAAGQPWPGYCRYYLRLAYLTLGLDLCGCCGAIKGAADDKAVELANMKW